MRANKSCLITTSGLLSIALLSGVVLSSTHASADTEVVDQVRLVVPIACTMSGTGTTHTATLSPGTYSGATGNEYQNGIGKTTLTAICNDNNGFSIYAIGFTGNQYEGANHTKLIGQNTAGTISTKAYESTDTASNWSMKLTKVTDTSVTYNPQNLSILSSYDSWHAIPDTYTKVAQYKANTGSSTTDTTLGVKLETTYAAYISTSQPADIYEGQVKYTMVHPYDEEPLQPQPSTAGYINYYANASTAEGTMGRQSATDGNSVTLFASNFSRTGYGFAGWSDKFDYATNPEANFYGPNEEVTVPEGTTVNGLALYAVWIKSAGTMQANAASVCNSLTAATYDDEDDADESTWSIIANLNSVSALTDTRDNQTYAIAKLTDSNCWMIENLRLVDKDSNNNYIELSSTNTNNPSLPLTNIYDSSTTSNHLSPTSSVAYDATTVPEGWCTSNSAACDNQSRLRTDNTANRVSYAITDTMSANVNFYSYGNYYNWYSATAGNGTYNKSTSNATGDICPTGWHLPTGTNTGEFAVFSNSLGGYKDASNVARPMGSSTSPTHIIMAKRLRHFPNNYLMSGSVSGVSLYHGNNGLYWSSTASSNTNLTCIFSFTNSYLEPGCLGENKYVGMPVRCIATSI